MGICEGFGPGQQCCIGVSINVQKFEAHSHLRFHDTDHGEHLYFLPSCVSVVGSGRRPPRCGVHTRNILREKGLRSPRSRDSRISIPACSAWAAKGCRIEYRRSRTPDSLARLALSDSTAGTASHGGLGHMWLWDVADIQSVLVQSEFHRDQLSRSLKSGEWLV